MSVVRVILAGGLVPLAVMADRLFGFRVGRRQWLGLTAMAIGLGLIVATKPPVDGAHSAFSATTMGLFEVGLLAVAALVIVLPRLLGALPGRRALALALASGLLFGVSDVALKALTGLLGDHGPLGVLSPWLVIAIVASITSFFASARALQDGAAVPVIALTGTAANVVGIAGGFVVFGDPMPASGAGIALQVVGFLLVVVAAALTPAPLRAAQVEAVDPQVEGEAVRDPDEAPARTARATVSPMHAASQPSPRRRATRIDLGVSR